MSVNRVLSFWKRKRNVGVLSTTDEEFIEEMKKWARENGYRVEDSDEERDHDRKLD